MNAALLDEFGLEQEGDELSALSLLLLLVGETGKLLAPDEGRAISELDVCKNGGRVADGRGNLAAAKRGGNGDQL